MNKKNWVAFLQEGLTLIMSLLIVGCSSIEDSGIITFDENLYNKALSTWITQNFQNYSFTYTAARGDTYPYDLIGHVIVTEGTGIITFESHTDLTDAIEFYPTPGDAYYITDISQIYSLIYADYTETKTTMEAGTSIYKTAVYTISYDSTYSYPIIAKNNYVLKSNDYVGDSGLSIKVSDFLVIN
jgi:hypothetical protein